MADEEAKVRVEEAEKKTSDLIGSEIKAKQVELATLVAEKAKLDEEIQKKRQELSEPQINRLDYFEAEVRRLEQKLTQQKTVYDKRVKELEDNQKEITDQISAEDFADKLITKVEGTDEANAAPPSPNKTAIDLMPYEEVMSIDKLADDINNEISELAFGLEPGYDWELADLLLQSQKAVNNFLDKVLATGEDTNARVAFRKLRTRMYLGTQQFKKVAEKAKKVDTNLDSNRSGVTEIYDQLEKNLEAKNKKMEEMEKELNQLKSGQSTENTESAISFDEVLKMDQLADLINTEVSEVTLMSTEPKETEYDWQLIDLLLDAQKTIYGAFDKIATKEENAKMAVRKLRQRMYIATNTIKKSI